MAGARATIRDVAREAGVSIATVSYAVNAKGELDAATRERVLEVARRMGYRPNRAARAMRAGRSGVVALLLPLPGGDDSEHEMLGLEYYMRLASAATRAAFGAGLPLLLAPPADDVSELVEVAVDGAIICDPSAQDPRLQGLEAAGVPVVTVERDVGRPDHRWHVSGDNAGDTRRLLDHLADAGAERIALLAPTSDWAWAQESTAAYEAWCTERGREAVAVPTSLRRLEASAHDRVRDLLGSAKPPDAILGLAERHATGAARAALEQGLRIPDDLLVASGIDGADLRHASPAITAIDLLPEERGAKALAMLLARMAGDAEPAPDVVPAQLHVRASTRRR